jgi:hypothetical protein
MVWKEFLDPQHQQLLSRELKLILYVQNQLENLQHHRHQMTDIPHRLHQQQPNNQQQYLLLLSHSTL